MLHLYRHICVVFVRFILRNSFTVLFCFCIQHRNIGILDLGCNQDNPGRYRHQIRKNTLGLNWFLITQCNTPIFHADCICYTSKSKPPIQTLQLDRRLFYFLCFAVTFCFLRLFCLFIRFRAFWHSGLPQIIERLFLRTNASPQKGQDITTPSLKFLSYTSVWMTAWPH